MLPNMLELHLEDLPEDLQQELLSWIEDHIVATTTYPPLSTSYNLKQKFKFSDPVNYHITTRIFSEAMHKLGHKGRLIKEDDYHYKVKLRLK